MAELRANLEQGFYVAFRYLKNHAFVESARVNRHSPVPEVAQAANDALTNVLAVAAREGVRREDIKTTLRNLEEIAEDDADSWAFNRPTRPNGHGHASNDVSHITSNGDGIAADIGQREGDSSQRRTKPKRLEEQPFPYVLAKDIDQNETKDELIAGFIDADEMAGIFGPMEAGKSNLAVDLGCHVGCRPVWCGRKVKNGPVVYFAPERSKVVRRRVKAWMLHHKVDDLPIAIVGCGIDLRTGIVDTKRCIETIRDVTRHFGKAPIWAIFDTYACVAAGGDEGAKDTGAVMHNMAKIRQETGVIITPIMHPPVDRDDRPRGHTSLPANMGTTIQVTKRDGGGLRAIVKKANDQPDEGRSYHDFRYESVKLYLAGEGNWVTAPVIVQVEGGAPPREFLDPGKKLSGPERTFLEAFLDAIAKAPVYITLSRDGVEGPKVTAVDLAAVREEFNRRCGTGEADPQKRAKVQRGDWYRARRRWPGRFATEERDSKELIWQVKL
jgi:hypothetical protein